MDIHSFTESIVKKYHTRNPFEIIQSRNAILIYAPLVDVRGFYQYFQRNHIIYIDENLPEKEKYLSQHMNWGICSYTEAQIPCIWIHTLVLIQINLKSKPTHLRQICLYRMKLFSKITI